MKPVEDEPSVFSGETEDKLRQTGRLIYPLTGRSIINLREDGLRVSLISNRYSSNIGSYPSLEDDLGLLLTPSRTTQIAITPEPELYLPNSYGNSPQEREVLLNEYTAFIRDQLGRDDVVAIVGKLADYLELFLLHQQATGEVLFNKWYWYQEEGGSKMPVGKSVITATSIPLFGPVEIKVPGFATHPSVSARGRGRFSANPYPGEPWIVPLIVPATTKTAVEKM